MANILSDLSQLNHETLPKNKACESCDHHRPTHQNGFVHILIFLINNFKNRSNCTFRVQISNITPCSTQNHPEKLNLLTDSFFSDDCHHLQLSSLWVRKTTNS